MAVEVRFAPEAAGDVTAGFRWYEEQRRGLGSQFLDCVLVCLERVRRSPELHERVHGEFRRDAPPTFLPARPITAADLAALGVWLVFCQENVPDPF